MSYSYWMENQDGNFTNDKKDTFNHRNRYIGIRLQQGVPLLDRDWNELEDIRRYEEVALRRWYIGNGSPDNGFKISALDTPANDFKIGTGRCMVEGFEAVNDPQHYDKSVSRYKEQQSIDATIPDLTPPPPTVDRADIVYLDVWIEEVMSKGAADPLHNPQDLNEPTTVRHKLVWRVRVAGPGVNYKTNTTYHHYYEIAKITRKKGTTTITNADIEDLREALGKKALNLLQRELEDLIRSAQPAYRYLSLKNTLRAFSDVYELFKNDPANDVITKVSEALTNKVYTDPTNYFNAIEEISVLESKLYIRLSWDDIPGNDSDKLIDILNKKLDIGLPPTPGTTIQKSADGNSININNGEFLLTLNATKTRATVYYNRDYEFIVKTENSKLYIYEIIPNISNNIKYATTESLEKYIASVRELDKAINEGNVAIVEVVQNEVCGNAAGLVGLARVPNVINRDIDRAAKDIQRARLRLGTVSWVSGGYEGRVMDQYPKHRDRSFNYDVYVPVGSPVHLVVSLG